MSEQTPLTERPGYTVRLEGFEGPFALLLSLIAERRMDVCDIPIARLTEDYLAHLRAMEDLDLDVATEFLVVATTLLQMKARALLPKPATDDEADEQDVERDLLIARLLEVRTFQAAGGRLADLLAEGDRRFPPTPARDDEALRQMPTLADILPHDLGRVLVELVRDQVRTVDTSLLVAEEVSTQEAAAELHDRLRRGGVRFRELVAGRSLGWAVAFFLAMLELGARGEITLGQAERLGDIAIELVTEDQS